MSAKILYEKRGRRYIQVNDPWAYYGLGKGDWLVKVKPGVTSVRLQLEPDHAALDAALRDFEDALVDALHEASKLRSSNQKISEKERKAWDVFTAAMGADMPTYFAYPSLVEIAQAGVAAVREKILNTEKG